MLNDFIKQVIHHQKELNQEEKECFVELKHPKGKIVLVPIYVNGHERFGIASIEMVPQGTRAKILAVLVSPEDKVLVTSGEEMPIISGGDKETEEEVKKFLN